MRVDLYVVLRKVVRKHLDSLCFLDLTPSIVTVSDDSTPVSVNFLPNNNNNKNNSYERRLKFLFLLLTILFFSSLYIPLARYDLALKRAAEQVEVSRIQAARAQTLEDKKTALLQRIDFLSARRNESAPMIILLQELTHRLPDDTWIYHLLIRNRELQIHGEATAASSLIRMIEASPYFEHAQFISSVTKNNIDDKEHFHISARLTPK